VLPSLNRMVGHGIFLATQAVLELRYGAFVAVWGDARLERLQRAIARATVVPVSDALVTAAADLRYMCRLEGHALHDKAHGNDLWIAATAVHLGIPLLTTDEIFNDCPGLRLATGSRTEYRHPR
jgi:predicted nucleic acid-binding protein